MTILFSLFKLPFINRLINTVTTSKKSTCTLSFLVGASMIGLVSPEQIELLSGLDPYIVIPVLSTVILIIFIQKGYNFFIQRDIIKYKNELEKKKIIAEIQKYDMQIKH